MLHAFSQMARDDDCHVNSKSRLRPEGAYRTLFRHTSSRESVEGE